MKYSNVQVLDFGVNGNIMIIFLEFKIQVLFETSSICFHYVCGSGILYFLTTSRSPIIVVKLNCVRCMIFYHQLFCYSFAMIYHSLYPPRQGHLRLRILCIISIAYYNSISESKSTLCERYSLVA